MTWKVTLRRGGSLPSKTWEHTTHFAARRRAEALEELHGCESSFNPRTYTFTVFAGSWYTKEVKK